MKDSEIIDLYWARNEKAIAATKEKYGNYCHTIAFNILFQNEKQSNDRSFAVRRECRQ